jgi:predicted methyltransferase
MVAALKQGAASVTSSLDLNLTRTVLQLTRDAVVLPDCGTLDFSTLREMSDDENACYLIEADRIAKIQAFSEETNRHYSLYPTESAPTMLVSGIPMHRIKETDPWRDTQAKIKAVSPVRGKVLDTCTGLGYTALTAARTADHVTTIELDPAAHSIVRCNPWSCQLFSTPNIAPLVGDSAERIADFAEHDFDVVVHDPPMFSLAGDLYSLDFYREILRVLRRSGRLFHYIGNPDSRSGATVTRGVVRRLHEAGFLRITPHPEAFGVTAIRP